VLSGFWRRERVIYLLWFVVAATAGALGYAVCIRTGWVGCLLVALAAPFAFALIGVVMRLFVPPASTTDCDPCGLGSAFVLILLSGAATVGIWLGVAVAVLHRRASD
jgi:hypothetical protein